MEDHPLLSFFINLLIYDLNNFYRHVHFCTNSIAADEARHLIIDSVANGADHGVCKSDLPCVTKPMYTLPRLNDLHDFVTTLKNCL